MKSDETLTLLVGANPVREEDVPSAQTAAARALRERIELLAPSEDRAERPVHRPAARRSRRWPLLAGTAVALAVAVVATLPRALTSERFGASPAAAAVLERAAIASTAYTGEAEGLYAYTKAQMLDVAISTDSPPFTLLTPTIRETWVAADGSGRLVETREEPIFPGPRDRERWKAAGAWQPPRELKDTVLRAQPTISAEMVARDPKNLTLEQLDRLLLAAIPQLPTDPDRLERIVRAYSEKKDPPVEAQMFNQVSSILNSPFATAELRAAAYRVLARVDGVELEGERRDAAGRLGTAITAPAGYGGEGQLNRNERRRLIIDPRTGNVLAEETVLVRRVEWMDGEPGDVVGSITILEHGWINSMHERPRRAG